MKHSDVKMMVTYCWILNINVRVNLTLADEPLGFRYSDYQAASMLPVTEMCWLGNRNWFGLVFFFFHAKLFPAKWSTDNLSEKLTKYCCSPTVLSSQHKLCLLCLGLKVGTGTVNAGGDSGWSRTLSPPLGLSSPFSLRFWFLCSAACRHLVVTNSRASSDFTNPSWMAHHGCFTFLPSWLSGRVWIPLSLVCRQVLETGLAAPLPCLWLPGNVSGRRSRVGTAWEVLWGTTSPLSSSQPSQTLKNNIVSQVMVNLSAVSVDPSTRALQGLSQDFGTGTCSVKATEEV